MAKKRNKLFPNPSKAFNHEKGTSVVKSQPLKVKGKKFVVPALNVVQFYLQKAQNAEELADGTRKEILDEVINHEKELPYYKDDKLFTFLDEATNTIVWAFTAIEAKSNNLILSLAPLNKQKRYIKLDLEKKVKTILPKICKQKQISKSLYGKFCHLEDFRHKIIHTKSAYWYNGQTWSESLLYRFICNADYKGAGKTAKQITNYFNNSQSGPVTLKVVQRGLQPEQLKK